MRPTRILALFALTLAVIMGMALSGMVACPLSHDGYETDRPCWNNLDCVSNEVCGKVDGGELLAGKCGVPSDGPCGFLDAGGTIFYCFPDSTGRTQSCHYNPQDRCTRCGLDGSLPDGGCPEADCLEWRDRWGCL